MYGEEDESFDPMNVMKTTPCEIVQLKIVLLGAKPQIWRRIEMPGECTLGDLHTAIQVLFGWEDAHLHEFELDGRRFGDADERFGDPEAEDAGEVRLSELSLPPGARFLYTCDFGDNWEHGIEVEGYIPRKSGVRYPRCTKAVRAGPPEDSGGVYGYTQLLRIYKNPRHSEHEEVCEWLGEDFDPTTVDAERLTDELVATIDFA